MGTENKPKSSVPVNSTTNKPQQPNPNPKSQTVSYGTRIVRDSNDLPIDTARLKRDSLTKK